MMTTATRYTMADIRAANKAAGLHFFDRDTMRFFASRVEGGPYTGPGGVYFVTSEKGATDTAPRMFTVRRFDPDTGGISWPGTYGNFHDRDDARDAAKYAARTDPADLARVAELEAVFKAEEISEANGARAQYNDDDTVKVRLATCGNCGRTWNDALISGRTPTPSARCPYESIHPELAELDALRRKLGRV